MGKSGTNQKAVINRPRSSTATQRVAGRMSSDAHARSVETYKKRANTGDDVFVRVIESGGNPAPTAVLFGWFGAKPRHVTKYAMHWEALGCSTVVVVAPTSVVFSLNHRNIPPFVLSVLGIVASDARLLSGGLITHFFSNGGAVCAPVMATLLSGGLRERVPADAERSLRQVRAALAAVVFDSAPAYMHLHAGINAFTTGLGVRRGTWVAALLRAVFIALSWLQRLVYGDVANRFWTAVRTADYQCAEVYIYSRADILADSEMLEALIKERLKRFPERVRQMCVDDAIHVKIMLKYPSQYVEQMKGVLSWAVANWKAEKQRVLL